MRILLDEMYPAAIAEQLRARGLDVEAVVEAADLRSRSDEEVFAVAQSARRSVVTENVRDFLALAAEHAAADEGHCGLILLDARVYPRGSPRTIGRMVTALAALLEQRPGEAADSFVHWL
ncbi:MAG: DUF5615 family PIN-like protein [Solirubrobacteraceae bacterium]